MKGFETINCETLREFDKETIIRWLTRKHVFLRGRRSELLYACWELANRKLLDDEVSEVNKWQANKPDFAVHDALARRYNASTDINDRIRLANQMKPFSDALRSYLKRTQALVKRRDKVDAMYQAFKDQQAKEDQANAE